eukprot:Sspe_Gene.53810::Locus_29711_Transcript_1_2_Confidence_0.750_Length_633::g.53810::m.53810/K16904/DCTPP1; dCTP diphosphatase
MAHPWSPSSLESIRRDLERFAQERGWEQHHTPRNLVFALQGEVSELAEIFQWKGDVAGAPVGLSGWSEAEKKHVAQELSDVLLYTVRMADRCGIDLAAAVTQKLEKNARKYPADVCMARSQHYSKQSESQSSASAKRKEEKPPEKQGSMRLGKGERPPNLDAQALDLSKQQQQQQQQQ